MPTLIIQPDSEVGEDSYINGAAGATGDNYGSLTTMILGWVSATGPQRSLLRFSLTPLIGMKLDSAKLTFYCTVPSAWEAPINIARATRAWVQSQVTWLQWATGQNWTTAGGDYDLHDSVGTLPIAGGTWELTEPSILAICNDAVLNRAGVASMLLRRATESEGVADGRATVNTSDVGTVARRPKLTIDYHEDNRRSGPAVCQMASALRGARRGGR